MSTLLNQLSLPMIQLERTLGMPEGGPKCLPLTLDFSAITSYALDYCNMQSRNFLNMVQTVWCDNSLSATVATIFVPGTGQIIKVPAGVQGYFPVLSPNPLKMVFGSAGGVTVQFILLNFPVLT